MFFVVNTTKQSLSISDLKLILGPRQGIDLDVKYTREQAEKSKGMKSLISKGLISVKNKTEPIVKSHFVQEVHNHNNEFDADKMKEDIMSGVKEIIAEGMPKQIPTPQQNINVEELAKMISKMIPQGINNQNTNFSTKDKEVEVDDTVLADIHSRAVEKIVKDVESGEINYEQDITENDIDDNIDELEGLLG